ncbi:protein MAATS1-like [Histomonas meleagridis]|uniref:protein MAATS1-like n=1 Tax=Histomonas meleagridis TaxID=135588 RepID=UPI00355AB27A|nr:protein MAATS1-like [Histomonas meleagridis]KAH0801442.1 protein MAATS1-like [Histomonas meleagridis]
MSYAVTKTRQFDYRYDPFYRDSTMRPTPNVAYCTTLQNTDVNGSDRPLFFASPITSNVTARPPDVILATTPITAPESPHEKKVKSHKKVDVAVQTAYRESSGQTDPWLPDTTDHTQPRAWFEEEELENLSIEERQKRLIEIEVEQWAKRDRYINEIQQQRLNLLVKSFQQREDEDSVIRQRRVESVITAREEKRKAAIERIEKKRLKVLRTLTEQRRQMTSRNRTTRDIINEYSNKGSSAYAPLRRNGKADSRCYMNKAVYGKRDVNTDTSLNALNEIESMYSKTQVKPLRKEKNWKRSEKAQQEYLKTVEQSVLEKRGDKSSINNKKKVQPLKIAQRIEKPPPRPQTPVIQPNIENDEREMAIILLQRLIRGRSMQNEMYHSLENQRQLIRELRTIEALKEVEEKSETKEEKEIAENLRNNIEKTSNAEGKVIGEMLVFLNNQLQRRMEERRIDAMMKLAERERRRREAEENGRREEEIKRQKIEDEAFRKIMGVNYETADSYLESIINESINVTANDIAKNIAMKDAEKITNFTATAANSGNDQAIVARDLVAAFLFPEVEKETIRKRLRIEQNKFKHAAENAIKKIDSNL